MHLKKDLETAEFADHQPIEEQMDWHERLRLLYVAATRARDHLIVSVHRKEGSSNSTAAELFYESGWDPALVSELGWGRRSARRPGGATAGRAGAAGRAEVVGPDRPALPAFEQWERERSAAFVSASRPVAVSATRLAEEAARALELEALAGTQKDPRDIDLPPWQKGRYGSAIGRAVHAVLQTVDLSTGRGLAEASRGPGGSRGRAREGGGDRGVLSFGAGIGRRRGRRPRLPHWREVYVGIPYGDGVLEGYIDLLYRSPDGLVVVDYKTDSWRGEADLQRQGRALPGATTGVRPGRERGGRGGGSGAGAAVPRYGRYGASGGPRSSGPTRSRALT